jgi:molecular chaperone DnaK
MESTVRAEDVDDLEQGSEIGSAVLPLRPNLPEGAPIEVTFGLNQQGRLHITGRDMAAGGKTVEATIETNRALSEQELAAATARARSVKVMG